MHQLCTNGFCVVGQIDVIDVGADRHQRANRALGQLQHAADHHPLATVEQLFARRLAVVEQVGDLFADLLYRQFPTAQQTQDGVGRALAHRSQSLHGLFAAGPGDLVEQLDQDRETNGRVQVALRNVEAQTLSGQRETDHHQEAQTEHDDRWVGVDETGQRLAGDDHQADGDDHRDHHDRQFIDHAHGGNDRVKREHRVEHHDLRDDRPEQRVSRVGRALADMAFESLVQFHRRFEQQEHTTEQHDQVTTGETVLEHFEQRLRQGHQPGNTRQQAQAHQQGQGQTDDSRTVTLLRRQLVRKDGDKHQVVDAEHQLQHDQRQQAQPRGGVSYPFHKNVSISSVNSECRARQGAAQRPWRCNVKAGQKAKDRVFRVHQARTVAPGGRITGRLREGVHASPERKKALERTGESNFSYSQKSLQNLYTSGLPLSRPPPSRAGSLPQWIFGDQKKGRERRFNVRAKLLLLAVFHPLDVSHHRR
ncbi:hypothetical protein PS704_05800 [Pseudomonas fluorescens]|uniref:Uncharacterized protein n=1 Tax=Pseudomonas fluorescens TaxID=294 RepID=A0A5E7FMP3_PSEFL|nr:hypothetical protein PS704_05800 [Pseudomonas fluorescens]